MAASHPRWALGFQAAGWWSRLARPSLRTWADGDDCLRLIEQTVAKDDPDPKPLACYWPVKRPWLNAIEATWVHGKRRVIEADHLLTIDELAEHVSDAYGCHHELHLAMPEKVA